MEYTNSVRVRGLRVVGGVPGALTLIACLVTFVGFSTVGIRALPAGYLVPIFGTWFLVVVFRSPTLNPAFVEFLEDGAVLSWRPPGNPRQATSRLPYRACRAFISAGTASNFPTRGYARVMANRMELSWPGQTRRDEPPAPWRQWQTDPEVILTPENLVRLVDAWAAWAGTHPGDVPAVRPSFIGVTRSVRLPA